MNETKGSSNRSPAEKRALLTRILEQKADRATHAPLSFAQQRLWILNQFDEGSAAYNISRAVRLKGNLDLQALRDSLNEIVARHNSLRTSFISINGQPVQHVCRTLRIEPDFHDLQTLPVELRESEARRQVSEAAGYLFDLQRDPLLRVSLFRIDESDHVLLLVMHHIVSDGWSLGVFFRELTTLYEAFVNAQPSPLPPLAIQYTDFARWEHQSGQEVKRQTDLSFWKKQLAGAPPLMELPTDRARPAIQSFAGDYFTFEIGKDTREAINGLARRENVTLFMILLAAFQMLLHRYTDRRDILVGSPIANRTRAETEDLIGFFVNTLVLRTDFSGRPTFRELLKRVKQVALDGFDHQDLPFERLVQELQPERSLAFTPIVQILFALQNVPRSTLKLGELHLTDFPFAKRTSKLDLSLYVGETSDGLALSFEYSTALFDSSTIRRMAGHYERLLHAITTGPDQRVDELPLLDDAEQHQLSLWNRTAAAYPADRCLHELFAEQARNTPDRTALICEGQRLTFSELNSAANQLAHFLRRHGVAPEVRVAVCMDRSPEMMTALLAILKEGGCFVPIDPSYPPQRVSWLLENSKAPILLTKRQILTSLPAFLMTPVCIDSDWPQIALESTEEPEVRVHPENAAYVIYTSGSTGNPKGSVSPHLASLNRFEWMWRAFPFTSGEVCCQKTSLSFGDAIWEIFGPLLKGVPLVIIPDQDVKDPEQFISTLAANKITRLVLVPSLLRVLLDQKTTLLKRLSLIKLWTSSGEALPADLARRFTEKLPDSTLINLYGSSEVAADVTCFVVKSVEENSSIPIGRPIANTAAYVLDADLRPVPLGVYGELCISGPGLARGYLDQPQITAENFLPDSQNRESGVRMFRTGDRARFSRDGTLEFGGRKDFQVKIRGFRVELGEIENHLRQHPDVSAAVVALEQLSAVNQGLYGYVVPRRWSSDPARLATELKEFLKERLPEYMVPARLAVMKVR